MHRCAEDKGVGSLGFLDGLVDHAAEDAALAGGIVICESETKLVLPAEVGGLQLKKQYKYGKVLLWKYVRPMADAAEEEGEA